MQDERHRRAPRAQGARPRSFYGPGPALHVDFSPHSCASASFVARE